MNREIKYRAFDSRINIFHYWDVSTQMFDNAFWDIVKQEKLTPNEFTGLQDKNGKDIYEGDVVKYYNFKRYVQQSHADVRPEIDEMYISLKVNKIVFKDGCFQINNSNEEPCVFPITDFGLQDVVYIKEQCGCVDDEATDCNGNEINESVLGIEVIGNIYEHPELLTTLPQHQ